MEKVKLKNETVLEFKEILDNGYLSITFVGQDISDLRTLFDNPDNVAEIEILTEGNEVCAIYNGYQTDKYIIQGDEITVYLIKPDRTQQTIQKLQQRIDVLQETIDTLVLESLEG